MPEEETLSFAGEKVVKIGVRDLLGVPVDAIVNPANSGLSHGGGLAAVISEEAGPELDAACRKIVGKIGRIPVTMAVPTKAYALPFKGIIHAVGPNMGSGDEKDKLKRTITNALLVADRKKWASVAFPAISNRHFRCPERNRRPGVQRGHSRILATKPDTTVSLIWLCLTTSNFDVFKKIVSPFSDSDTRGEE